MWAVLLDIGRFFAVFVGTLIFGAVLQAFHPTLFIPVAAVIALGALIALVRRLPLGWLRHRGATSGLLAATLILMLAFINGPDDRPVQAAGAPGSGTPTRQFSQNQAAKKAVPKDPSTETATPAVSEPDPLQDRSKQLVWIAVSKDAVRSRLKDPSSARFRKVAFHAYQGKTPVVCGEVDGKNSFGGYSGYEGFIASGETIVVIETDFAAGEFAKAWNKACLG